MARMDMIQTWKEMFQPFQILMLCPQKSPEQLFWLVLPDEIWDQFRFVRNCPPKWKAGEKWKVSVNVSLGVGGGDLFDIPFIT